jgi:hypothetical protein
VPVVAFLLSLLLSWLWPSDACGYITDSAVHPPPACGAYAYDTFTPAQVGFPATGQSYVDPVFGETLLRLSSFYPSTGGSGIIYGINGLWNADGTRYLHHNPSNQVDVINTTTGAVVRANVPYATGTNQATSFAPDNPDIFYYTSGTILKSYSITSNTSSNVKTFGGTLSGLASSADWIDTTGRYFLLNIAGQLTMWDKTSDILFTGTIAFVAGNTPWAGLSPDGKFIIISGLGPSNNQKVSYAVNLAAHTVTTTGVLFWDACFGDHGDVMTASDGNTYFFSGSCRFGDAGLYRISVTNAITADSSTQLTMPGNHKFITLNVPQSTSHNACAAMGAQQDWCFMSVEDPDDLPASAGTWYAYKQEIIMFQMVAPFEVRRLVHHRSRVISHYCSTPRINPNWQGTAAMLTSAMSIPVTSGCGYSDLWRWGTP